MTKAAEVLGINPGAVYESATKGRERKGYRFKFCDATEIPAPPKRTAKSFIVDIEGVRFYSVDCPNKMSCRSCDILREWPVQSTASFPKCYDYACGNFKIVQLCQGRDMVWKKQ